MRNAFKLVSVKPDYLALKIVLGIVLVFAFGIVCHSQKGASIDLAGGYSVPHNKGIKPKDGLPFVSVGVTLPVDKHFRYSLSFLAAQKKHGESSGVYLQSESIISIFNNIPVSPRIGWFFAGPVPGSYNLRGFDTGCLVGFSIGGRSASAFLDYSKGVVNIVPQGRNYVDGTKSGSFKIGICGHFK